MTHDTVWDKVCFGWNIETDGRCCRDSEMTLLMACAIRGINVRLGSDDPNNLDGFGRIYREVIFQTEQDLDRFEELAGGGGRDYPSGVIWSRSCKKTKGHFSMNLPGLDMYCASRRLLESRAA